MCAGLCPTYWTTFGNAEENRNGSCPMHEWDHPPFFEFFNSSSPPQGPIDSRGGHVGRHCPYTNKLWCGSVHALLRYRSKITKMQKFPIDSYSNENFISPFFRPPWAANPQKGKDTSGTRVRPHAKFGLNKVVEKSLTKKSEQTKKHTVKQIPRPSL